MTAEPGDIAQQLYSVRRRIDKYYHYYWAVTALMQSHNKNSIFLHKSSI